LAAAEALDHSATYSAAVPALRRRAFFTKAAQWKFSNSKRFLDDGPSESVPRD
jgi:hypothetical protein